MGDPAPPQSGAARAHLAEVARRWIRLWQGGGLAEFAVLHAPDFVDHSPAGRGRDRTAFKRGIEDLYRAFPDFRATVEDLIVDEAAAKVAVRWSGWGTHRGEFLGVSTSGRRVHFEGIEILTIRGGRVAERWGEWDGPALVQQVRGEG